MRLKFQTMIVVAVTVLFMLGCSNEKGVAAIDMDKARVEIQAMEDAYAAADKAKDADKIVAYYSDDAITYGRGRMPEVGKDAIKAGLVKRFAEDTTGNTNVYKVVDLFGEGNMLVEIGSWTELNPAGAEVDKGHYMSFFQKKDAKWVCVRDMSVSSNPVKK
jgi:uncharacterized protein (TIGR02246 family)